MAAGLRSLPGRLVRRWFRATLKRKGLFESRGWTSQPGTPSSIRAQLEVQQQLEERCVSLTGTKLRKTGIFFC